MADFVPPDPHVRRLPAQEERVETGAVQFGSDWPGVFIRGDDMFGFTVCLNDFVGYFENAPEQERRKVWQALAAVSELSDLMDQARVGRDRTPQG
jgi:hypothetical protein